MRQQLAVLLCASLMAGPTLGSDTGTVALNGGSWEDDGALTACGLDIRHVFAEEAYLDGEPLTLHAIIMLEADDTHGVAGRMTLAAETAGGENWPVGYVYLTSYGEPIMQNNTSRPCPDDEDAVCHTTEDGFKLANGITDNALGINYIAEDGVEEGVMFLNLWQPAGAAAKMGRVTECVNRLVEDAESRGGY